MSFSRRTAAFFLLIVALSPCSAFAATTGILTGVATDGTGAALPGVTVTVTSPQLQGSRSTVTNDRGEYTLSLLPPGTYRVEFTLGGFDTVFRENVRVSVDTTTKVDAPMALGAMSEAITVTAEAVLVDPTSTTTQQNFGPQHLKYSTIGSLGRSYQGVLQQAPGVAGGNNPNVMGANQGQNNYMLDGVNTTDPVTHTFGSNLPFDAIQEVSLQTLGKDAAYGRAVGGVVNVVTKSGGNELSGTFDGRYTSDEFSDTNEFYGDDQEYQSFRPAATLGGPILRDRLWFFGTLERLDNKTTAAPVEYGGANGFKLVPGTFAFEGWNSLLKLTATPAMNHTVSLRYTDNRATISNAEGSAIYAPDADAVQDQDSQIYNVGVDSILTPNFLATVQVGARRGYLETRPMHGDIGRIALLNQTFGFYTNSYPNYQFGERNRDELIATATYFWQGAGTHTFKAGLNLDRAEFSSYNNFTGQGAFDSICTEEFGFTGPCGGYAHVRDRRDFGGSINEPYYAEVYQINPSETYNSNLRAYFLQDEWRPVQNITARLGLRYETMDFEIPGEVPNQPNFTSLQPRIGLAWDVFNDARTVLHGFWGEVMDDNGLSLASFGSTAATYVRLFLYNPATGRYDSDTGIFQGGASGNQYDPDLEPTVSTEANFGVRQRLGTNTSLDVTGVWRRSDNMFEDGCVDFDCHYFLMTNRPNGLDVLSSEYQGVVFKLESRPTEWLNALVSYAWSESKGSVEYTQNAGADFDVFPAHFVNREGYLSDDARHRVKASGFVRAPFGTTFGLDALYETGTPDDATMALGDLNVDPDGGAYAGNPSAFYGTVFVLPRGERRLPDRHRLDFQAMHEFTLGRVKMGLIGTIYNLLDSDIVTDLGSTIGTYEACDGPIVAATKARAGDCIANPLAGIVEGAPAGVAVTNTSFNVPVDSQLPRRYEFGLRFEF